MFARPLSNIDKQRLLVRLITADAALEKRLAAALAPTRRYHLETMHGTLAGSQTAVVALPPASLVVVDLDGDSAGDWTALERLLAAWPTRPAVVLLSERLQESSTRRLLRLQIADWLPRHSGEGDLLLACEQALQPPAQSRAQQALCLAFLSAIGGAGSTTLSLAAASALAGKGKDGLAKACVIDLDFQLGAISEHLDLTPNLLLDDIVAAPDRLDEQLLGVMLSRHASGLAVLASSPSLDAGRVDSHLIGRLLDLTASQFEHVVIDMPHAWLPWSESVARGVDRLYVVTELSVIGLKQARRVTDLLHSRWGFDVAGSIIVNKAPRFGLGSLKRRHARDILGDRLAGFIADHSKLTREAQTRGVLLSQIKRRNAVEADLRTIIEQRKSRATAK